MCGICGVINLSPSQRTDRSVMQRMLGMLHHRGPDGIGIYSDENATLGNARLSIIDLHTGDQPIGNEDGTLWIVLNGEIFNYVELRRDLEQRGHVFLTKSDTEVLLHAYEEFGLACLDRLNGHFSFAIWDNVNRSLILVRDRLGITPLFYSIHAQKLIFGSEIKALMAYPGMRAEINPIALQQVFTYWSVQGSGSIFMGIKEVPPGNYLIAKSGQISVEKYWSLDFLESANPRAENEYLEELEDILIDAVRLRLRADVPVGVYLSGGLDSSIIASIIGRFTNNPLETFSISFSDPMFDESPFQQNVARFLSSTHNIVKCSYEDIGNIFPDVIWHTETPIVRTAPAPMFLLSKLVNDFGYKVVLTGEGSDEFFGGYDIFKEMQIRRFWARNPESSLRPLLFKRLYKDIDGLSTEPSDYLKAFFKKGLTEIDSPYYSHVLRWNNSARNTRFLRHVDQPISSPLPDVPANFFNWSHLGQAQFLEIATFLSPYLLSSQGDRMAMANSVEERQPYLDHRIIEFSSSLPDALRLNGLREKWLLKHLGKKLLPVGIWKRGKKPYRAPINQCFFIKAPEYVKELLSEKCIRESGYFKTESVMAMIQKVSSSTNLGEVDSMAVAGIISTQLLHQLFIKDFRVKPDKSPILKFVER